MTLEDETGQVNVILWPGLLEKFRKEALGAALLAVYGLWQTEGKVRHLIARIARGASNTRERVCRVIKVTNGLARVEGSMYFDTLT
ncbi:hypothetical protein [Burkholderia multivorans]|uniref:hypothetical protein n=1 Tax=Burkholderia multivorans TaxID=87883 RepID=UPI0020B40B84|nr:hypothetical protein [Burkholderia multivorans]